MATPLGQIQLNGNFYRIDIQSYRGRDVNDFSPRASTPGGGIVFSQMDAYQVVAQEDWSHGFGFEWFDDSAGYHYTTGKIDPREPKRVGLWNESQTITPQYFWLRGVTRSFDGAYLIAYGTPRAVGVSGMFKAPIATPTVWTAVAAFADITVNCVWSNGLYTFAAIQGATGRLKKCNDATLVTWTDSGNTACCVNFNQIIPHDGFVYLSKWADGTGMGPAPHDSSHKFYSNQVYSGSANDLSDLEGSQDDTTSYITVGPPGEAVINMASFNGDLFFFRRDAIYKMNKDRSGAVRVLDYRDQYDSSNFDCVVVFNGSLYYNVGSSIYQWNGVRTQAVTPRRTVKNPSYPYTRYQKFYNACTIGKYMYVVACDSLGYVYLLSFDGVGWHELIQLWQNGDPRGDYRAFTGLSYIISTNVDLLFVGVPYSIQTQAVKLFYHQSEDGAGSTTYPAASDTYKMYLSKMDAGFRLVYKSTPSILVQKSSLSSSGLLGVNNYLKIYYSLDDGAFLPWGGIDNVSNKVDKNGITILNNPLGDQLGYSTLEYHWIQFAVAFYTSTDSITPLLEKFAVKVMLRPETSYGFSFNVVGAQDYEFDGRSDDSRTPYSIVEELRAARSSKKPIEFIDIFGDKHWVYVTSLQEIATEDHSDETGAHPNIEHLITVNLMEVSNT